MKVLSLFDGISCARVALDRAGIAVDSYYASEIDKYAMQVSSKNYPSIVHIGDVKKVHFHPTPTDDAIFENLDVDLLIGGSPCKDLSIAKKDRKGLDGERSGLFWEYVRILREVKPKYFILENVASMPKEAKEIITKELGVEPIMIDAGLVSAQMRKRLFWTNIPNVTVPEDRGLVLKDIVEPYEAGEKYTKLIRTGKLAVIKEKANTRTLDQKSKALTASGASVCSSNSTMLDFGDGKLRYPTRNELCRMQGLPDGYVDSVQTRAKYWHCVGNAFNVDVVAHILSFLPSND